MRAAFYRLVILNFNGEDLFSVVVDPVLYFRREEEGFGVCAAFLMGREVVLLSPFAGFYTCVRQVELLTDLCDREWFFRRAGRLVVCGHLHKCEKVCHVEADNFVAVVVCLRYQVA